MRPKMRGMRGAITRDKGPNTKCCLTDDCIVKDVAKILEAQTPVACKKRPGRGVHISYQLRMHSSKSPESDDNDKWDVKPKLLFGLPVALAFVLYINTLQAGFVYDDHRAIVNNPDVVGTSPWNSVWGHDFWGAPLQRKGSHGSWRPFTTFSFRLNALLSSELLGRKNFPELEAQQSLPASSSWHFHATNVILHGIVTCVYIGVLQSVGIHKIVCLWAGSLFAAHPVHVEAVGGVVGRAELLAAIAFCLAIGAYTFYLRGRSCGRGLSPSVCPCLFIKTQSSKEDEEAVIGAFKNTLWLWASVFATALGIMCKEQAVTALGVALVFHIALVISTTQLRKNLLHTVIIETWLTGMLAGLLIWCRLSLAPSAPSFTAADNPAAHAPAFLTRALSVGRYWVLHARLLLLPDILSFDWSMGAVPLVSSVVDIEALPVILLLVGGGILVVKTFKRLIDHRSGGVRTSIMHAECHDAINNNSNAEEASNRANLNNWSKPSQPIHVAFALALLIVPFLPASNLMAWVGFVAAERVLYLPSMGASLLIALGAQNLIVSVSDLVNSSSNRTNSKSTNHRKLDRRRRRNKALEIINFLMIILVLLFGARTVRRNSDWFSDETLYKSGIKVCPAKSFANLGVVYSDQGRKAEAEVAYRSALRYAPQMADTHYNLGVLLASTNRLHDAIRSFREALNSRPWLAQAHLALSQTLVQMGEPKEASKVLESCLKHTNAPAKDGMSHAWAITNCHQRLARIRIQDGRAHIAIDELQKSLQIAPSGYPEHAILTLMAEAYVATGEHAEAQEALRKALNVHPTHVPAHLAFSRLLQANGSKIEEAEYWLRRAVALAPNDAHTYKHLGQLLLEQGRPEAAIDPWLRAASLDPLDHTTAFNSATALRLAGRNHHAEKFYKKAVQLSPQDVSSQRNLGAILHLNGKLDEALIHYDVALAMAPGDPQTITNLNRLKALLNKKGPL